MELAVIQFSISALIVITAGIYLTRCADKVAEVSGLGGLLVGSVFLAAATSLPELMVDMSAVRQGLPNIAIGDLFGSSLFNLFILALCDLLHQSRGRMFSHASVMHALSATQSILMTSLAGVGLFLAPNLSRFAVGPIGLSSIALMGAYLLGLRLVFKDQRYTRFQEKSNSPKLVKIWSKELVPPALGYFTSAGIILLAAPFVAKSSATIADLSGLGTTFIGTSLVAFCTSLPELVASFSAVRIGSYDLALGNIFGSNAFNMLLIVPLDFISEEPILSVVSPTHLVTCLATITITGVAIMGQLYQVEKRRMLFEPDALLVVLLVMGSLGVIYFFQ